MAHVFFGVESTINGSSFAQIIRVKLETGGCYEPDGGPQLIPRHLLGDSREPQCQCGFYPPILAWDVEQDVPVQISDESGSIRGEGITEQVLVNPFGYDN